METDLTDEPKFMDLQFLFLLEFCIETLYGLAEINFVLVFILNAGSFIYIILYILKYAKQKNCLQKNKIKYKIFYKKQQNPLNC